MLKLGILGSTRGTAMQPILDAIACRQLEAKVSVVLSNKPDALILERARQQHIPAQFIDPVGLTRQEYDQQLSCTLQTYGVEAVVLIGYMRILSAPFIDAWQHRIINVHPSLLPAFANKMDKAVHEAVLQSGVAQSGCSVHEVTEQVDAGPVIVQKRCPVFATDTVELLKARVQQLEGPALIEAISLLLQKQRELSHA